MTRFLLMVAVASVAAVALAAPISADAPTAIPISVTFDDVDPCTGEIHTVSFDGVAYRHEHDGRVVAHSDLVITTTSGYVGHGVEEEIVNGQMFQIVARHMLVNPNGNRVQARVLLQVDLTTGEVRRDYADLRCVTG
jgi:hypothetical protein